MSATDAIAELRASIAAMTERLTLLTTVPPSVTVGSKLLWSIDGDNRRVGIALKDGAILQVKIVEEGAYIPHFDPRVRQRFATYADWIVSLPAGGTVTTAGHDTRTSVEKKLATSMEGLTDAQKVRKLLGTWGIRAYAVEGESPLEALNSYMQWVRYRRSELAAITEEEDIADPGRRRKLTALLARGAAKVQMLRTRAYRLTEEESRTKPARVYQLGTAKLYARMSGNLQMITERDGRILLGDRWANSFAEHGVPMKANGSPALTVRYRRQMYEL
jgi:hypothetical protein